MLGDSLRRHHTPKPSPDPPRRPRPPSWLRGGFRWWHWPLLALLVLGASFGIGYLMATQVLFPAPETAGAGIAVPELYGRTGTEAETLLRDAGLVPVVSGTLTSSDVGQGRVLAQDPVPGQQLRAGASVEMVLSAGPPSPGVPAVIGLGEATARELLQAVGFTVDVQQTRSPMAAGTVTRTEPAAGVERPLPATVTLIVSVGQPELEPDSIAGGGAG